MKILRSRLKTNLKHIFTPLFLLSALFIHAQSVDVSSLTGKVICGYQGWFNCYGDGAPVQQWVHWTTGSYQSNTPNPSANNINFELYPDITDYPDEVLFQTGLANFGDNRPARLFSSYPQATLDRHFAYMAENNIDGVALQRFIAVTFDPVFKQNLDSIAVRLSRAAEGHGRGFYMMYDITGIGAASYNTIKADWSSTMIGGLNITSSPAYIHQNGKPVVCLWGPGFTHVPGTAAEVLDLINWFKAQGCYVVGGTPTNWRTSTIDSKPGFENTYLAYDMISPWTVGRYTNITEVDNYMNQYLISDRDYCTANGIDYTPVVFSGFAWSNWNGGTPNQIPRDKGNFLWRQARNIRSLNIPSMYIAMFDEYDEATALLPAADSYFSVPTDQYFLTTSADGTYISSDFYLRLAGEATQLIKNQIPLSSSFSTPFSTGPIYFRTSIETGYDAMPNWLNTADESSIITNVIGPGPGGLPDFNLSTIRSKTGGQSLRLQGTDNVSDAGSYCYFKVFDVNIPVSGDTWLSFQTFPETELSRSISVDFVMTDGSNLRDSGAQDTNGIPMHPGAAKGSVGQWTEIVCNVGLWLEGKIIDRIMIAYDQGPLTGDFSTYIDDISVFENNSSCAENLFVTGSANPGLYQADNELSADAVFDTPANLIFKAGQCIELLPGFGVGTDVIFSAEIEGCGF